MITGLSLDSYARPKLREGYIPNLRGIYYYKACHFAKQAGATYQSFVTQILHKLVCRTMKIYIKMWWLKASRLNNIWPTTRGLFHILKTYNQD